MQELQYDGFALPINLRSATDDNQMSTIVYYDSLH